MRHLNMSSKLLENELSSISVLLLGMYTKILK